MMTWGTRESNVLDLITTERRSIIDVATKIANQVVQQVNLLQTDNYTRLPGDVTELGEVNVGSETVIYKTTPPALPSELTCAPLAANLMWHLHYGKHLPLSEIYYAKYMAGDIRDDVVDSGTRPAFWRYLPADLEIWYTNHESQLITVENLSTLMRDLGLNYGIVILDNVKSRGEYFSHAAVIEVTPETTAIINSYHPLAAHSTDTTIFEDSTISGFVLPCVYDTVHPSVVPILAYCEYNTIPVYFRHCKPCEKNIKIERAMGYPQRPYLYQLRSSL